VPIVPVSAHEAQRFAHAVAQQTFCAQLLWRHWLAVVHGWPSGNLPQLPLTQLFGDTQSAVVPQVILQAFVVASHTYGSHSVLVTDLHTPAPSHVRCGVCVDPTQVGAAHWVVLGQKRQAPLPLQVPSVPQVVDTVVAHCVAGVGAAPIGTLLHAPTLPVSAHDLHVPVQALLQQTPWAQNVLMHSTPAVHEAPLGFLPHDTLMHELGARHCALVVQALKHLVPLQTYGLHGTESGAVHAPVALQVEGPV
jgi:hypothetical protein